MSPGQSIEAMQHAIDNGFSKRLEAYRCSCGYVHYGHRKAKQVSA